MAYSELCRCGAQFGITVRQLEGVVTEYRHAFTTGVSMVLLVGAAVAVVGAVLAWFTYGKGEEQFHHCRT